MSLFPARCTLNPERGKQDIKEQLQGQLGGLPPNKLKLSTFSLGVLKETQVAIPALTLRTLWEKARVQDSGCRVQSAGCRVQGTGCSVQRAAFRVRTFSLGVLKATQVADSAPCTLHPAPCTLHPAPCTLNPAHLTLNPEP